MKSWRIHLLLLLAVLLPIRGAMAAAMLCPGSGWGAPAVQAVVATMPTGHGAMGHASSSALAGIPAAGTASEPGCHEVPGSQGALQRHCVDKCNLCAAHCSLTPLPNTLPTVSNPQVAAPVRFHPADAPPPEHLSSGPERPPRTC